MRSPPRKSILRVRRPVFVGAVLALLAILEGNALAGWPRHRDEGTPPPGRPRFIPHTYERAGAPLALGNHAAPSISPLAEGYYVGGGAPFHGDSRRRDEGTWGWDETGTQLSRRVRLGWFHGRRAQGGTGAYATDRER